MIRRTTGTALWGGIRFLILAAACVPIRPAQAQFAGEPRLPAPVADPLRINPAHDPVLALSHDGTGLAPLSAVVDAALGHYPAIDESEALLEEARAGRDVARAALLPIVDGAVTAQTRTNRVFDNAGTDTMSGLGQVDASLVAEQRLFDFGASSSRLRAARARIAAASAGVESQRQQVILATVDAWTQAQTAGLLTILARDYHQQLHDFRDAMGQRVSAGVAAAGDAIRVDSLIAANDARVARFRQQTEAARARLRELSGAPLPGSPGHFARARGRISTFTDAAAAVAAALETAPQLARIAAESQAADAEARAARADRFPTVGAGVDVGRSGQPELGSTRNRYAVRGRVTMRMRMFGGVDARSRMAGARADAAGFRLATARAALAREATTLWNDVRMLDERVEALGRAYLAARQSRDVVIERYRTARGSLLDVLIASDAFFNAAADYVTTLAESDAAVFALLARTGGLERALNVGPPASPLPAAGPTP